MLISLFISPVFATEINNPATCDSGTLSTDTGPTNLRANYESNTLNLKWHDENGTPITSNTCTYGGTITMPTAPTKRGYTFKGWKVITHTTVEYIESTGTQYINTNYIPSDSTFMQITFKVIEPSTPLSKGTTPIGGRIAWQHAHFGLFAPVNTLNRTYFYSGNTSCILDFDPLNKLITATMDIPNNHAEFSLDNSVLYECTRGASGVTYVQPLYLFLLNNNGAADTNNSKIRIYNVILSENNVPVHEFIPVKDSDGVACMYDEVTKQYFYNAGTGNFIAGPDL